jgi:hypothetical protein
MDDHGLYSDKLSEWPGCVADVLIQTHACAYLVGESLTLICISRHQQIADITNVVAINVCESEYYITVPLCKPFQSASINQVVG